MPTWLIWTLGLGVPLAAASVPIIIHLINLTRFRRIEWAAMEFLLNAYRKTRRRMQLESIIMLMLRVLAVILLAAALFPMGCERIKNWAQDTAGLSRLSLSTDAPLHMVMVFDDSASMAYTQEGQSSFERGRNYALTLIESLRPGRDRVSIVRVSDVYVPPRSGGVVASAEEADQSTRRRVGQLASLDLDSARDVIAATTVAAVDTNMLGALREAARAVESTPEQDAAALVVISDFLDSGWRELRKDGAVHRDFAEVVGRMNDRLKRSGTAATFFDAGFETTQNIAITSVVCRERVVGNGMEASLQIEVAYYATGAKSEARTVRLKYRIDGGSERPVSTPVTLLPGEIESVEVRLSARDLALKPDEEKSGASRNIEIFTDEADTLKADNSRSLVVHVVPNVPILVVNGVWHKNPDLDETFYLETALGISTSRVDDERGGQPATRITPNHVISMRPEQLMSVDSFLDYRLVILCNVKSLSEATVAKLEEFVSAGYGLMIFDGDQLVLPDWNQHMYKKGQGLLPAKLGGEGGNSDPAAAGLGMAPADTQHPVIRLFTETPSDVEIITGPRSVRNWRSIEIPQGAEADPLRPVETLISLNHPSGPLPLMLERPFGRGRVVYMATTAGHRWHELWRTNGLPLFLYLEIAHYLTGNEARFSNLSVGESWRRVLRQGEVAPRYTVRDPAGTQGDLLATAEQSLKLLEYGGTAQPGVYTVTALERSEAGEGRRKWQERFAVNLEARESNVGRLGGESETGPEGVLREAMPDMQFQFQKAGAELADGALAGSDQGGGLWLWLAVLGASFLMLETLWSAVISKPED